MKVVLCAAITSILVCLAVCVCYAGDDENTDSASSYDVAADDVNVETAEIDLNDIDWSQIDDIEAFAEEHGLSIGVHHADNIICTGDGTHDVEKYEHEREYIEELLAELETGECIVYYPSTSEMVIE